MCQYSHRLYVNTAAVYLSVQLQSVSTATAQSVSTATACQYNHSLSVHPQSVSTSTICLQPQSICQHSHSPSVSTSTVHLSASTAAVCQCLQHTAAVKHNSHSLSAVVPQSTTGIDCQLFCYSKTQTRLFCYSKTVCWLFCYSKTQTVSCSATVKHRLSAVLLQ